MDVEAEPASPSTSFSLLLLRVESRSPLAGGGSRSGRLAPFRAARHLPLPSFPQTPGPGDSPRSWNAEAMMGGRPVAAFRNHERGCTFQFPFKERMRCGNNTRDPFWNLFRSFQKFFMRPKPEGDDRIPFPSCRTKLFWIISLAAHQ